VNLNLKGRYAAFAMDEKLYYSAGITLSTGLLLMDFDTTQTTRKFQLNLGGRFNYMIHRLFITYAGLELVINNGFTTFSSLAFTAGGSIRLR
jgi:hypothetical protein